jgi:hypothetical protein
VSEQLKLQNSSLSFSSSSSSSSCTNTTTPSNNKATSQVQGLLALVKQLEIAFKEERDAFEESVREDKCVNDLKKISCCGCYQKVLAELAEATVVLQQILEDRSLFVKEETARLEKTISRIQSELTPAQMEEFQKRLTRQQQHPKK